MKIVVQRKESEDEAEVYQFPHIYMSDFGGLNNCVDVGIKLTCLVETIEKLSTAGVGSTDSDTPDPIYVEILPFLPKHVQIQFLQREDTPDILAINLDKKLQLLKIAEELCHNHQPNDAYRIRIYE